jgi:chromosome segregation ATPase
VHQAKQHEAAATKALGEHECQITEYRGRLAAASTTHDDLRTTCDDLRRTCDDLQGQLQGTQAQLAEAQQELEASRQKVGPPLAAGLWLPRPHPAPLSRRLPPHQL